MSNALVIAEREESSHREPRRRRRLSPACASIAVHFRSSSMSALVASELFGGSIAQGLILIPMTRLPPL
ncbi:Hypothetical protein A7982_10557 [Minicystis rosea]|nr:Hypothetical protein A7982_10557 [Minicystis rosea]